MKKTTLALLLLSTLSFGQTLERKGTTYYYNGHSISKSNLKVLYRSHPEALQSFKKGNLKLGLSSGFMVYGGMKLALRFANLADRNEFNFQNGAIDLGFFITGLLISDGMNDHFERAVSIYNKKTQKKTSFLIEPSKEKLGITIRF